MTELRDGQVLERTLRIHGVDAPVIVRLTPAGISFRTKGSKRQVGASWTAVVRASETNTDVPSYLFGKPLELLQHEAIAAAKRAAEREK